MVHILDSAATDGPETNEEREYFETERYSTRVCRALVHLFVQTRQRWHRVYPSVPYARMLHGQKQILTRPSCKTLSKTFSLEHQSNIWATGDG